jgi:hypothetical protein
MKGVLMKSPLAIVLSVLVAGGVVAANQLGAQTTGPSLAPAPTATGTAEPATVATVQNIVEITRSVPPGATGVDAFTVPTGVTLVITDIVVTNTGTAAVCGGAVNRTGGTAVAPAPTAAPGDTGTPTAPGAGDTPTATTTTPTVAPPPATTLEGATGTTAAAPTPSAGTLTQTDSTVTGPLCVPAQTTMTLPLTTGIEFTSGQVLQLLNAPAAVTVTPPTAGTGALAFHLRGVLMTAI